MSRFFVRPEQIDESQGLVCFDRPDAHHLCQVLRMRAGDTVWALAGDGCEHEAVLLEVAKSRVLARIKAKRALATEPPARVTVAQALPKTLDKLEWVIEHGTEAGAGDFLVFESARSRAQANRFTAKVARWQEIARSAAEQSHRALLPTVEGVLSFHEVLARAKNFDLALLAYEAERRTHLRDVLPKAGNRRILVLIGPEGGFTEDEVRAACDAGALPITLGPRILRTETAALVMLGQIMCLLGE